MRIDRLRLLSPAPLALIEFYRRVFGAQAGHLGVVLGDERIEIEPCPGEGADLFLANETGFQHFGIVVADMDAAFSHLGGCQGWRPISLAGPERLPKASGGATAFKFRDCDGHPLELLQFAPEAVPPVWSARFAAAPGRLFHGVDHSALTVRDGEASGEFFLRLGFACRHREVNVGPEQARLDGFAGLYDARVAILSLSPPDGARPGVELLEYRQPMTVARAADDGSRSATRLVIAGANGEWRPQRDLDGHRLGYAPERTL